MFGVAHKTDPFRKDKNGPGADLHQYNTGGALLNDLVCSEKYLFLAGHEGKKRQGIIYVYSLASDNLVAKLAMPNMRDKDFAYDGLGGVALHPDGLHVACASDGFVYEFDVSGLGEEAVEEPLAPVRTYTPSADEVLTQCVYTPSGRGIVASSASGSLLQWNHASPAGADGYIAPSVTYLGDGNVTMTCVATSQNFIVAGDEAGRVWVWRDPYSPPVGCSEQPVAIDVGHLLKKGKSSPDVVNGATKGKKK